MAKARNNPKTDKNLTSYSLLFLLSLCLIFSQVASAQDLTVSTPTTWDAGAYTYDNVLITNNSTLTLNGSVTLNTQNLTIDSSSFISSDAKGYPAAQGPGAGKSAPYRGSGAGYGGKGGDGSSQPQPNPFNELEITINQKKKELNIESPDPQQILNQLQSGLLTLNNNQILQLKIKQGDAKWKLKHKEKGIEIQSPSIIFKATASDYADNTVDKELRFQKEQKQKDDD